jgi:hypothetical protein
LRDRDNEADDKSEWPDYKNAGQPHSETKGDCHSGDAQFGIAIGELVKQESNANADRQADKPNHSNNCRLKFGLLGNEERHVGGNRQLRHLERHGNDHA